MAIKKKFNWLSLSLIFFLLVFSFWFLNFKLGNQKEIVFPVVSQLMDQEKILGSYQREASVSAEKKLGVLYGFLPYWQLDNYQLSPHLTHLSYFRLAVNGQGEIEKDGAYDLYQSEKWQKITQQIDRKKIKLEVTFFTSQSQEIKKLINCRSCQDLLIKNIETVVRDDQLDGVNLDLEYLGFISQEERDQFTDFVHRLRTMLDYSYPRTKLSIDVYGGAANMNNIWDFAKLGKIVDRVMIMGYDYKTKSSTVPGPSAPTLSKSIWQGDIWGDVQSLLRFVPSDKIILVIPFYGYAWETTTDNLQTAKTYPDTGETLTYRGAQNILKDKKYQAKEKWDENSLTPYLTFYNEETERWHIGFFENERSVGYKMDLVRKLNLSGMAIWALGYEGEYQSLWNKIGEQF